MSKFVVKTKQGALACGGVATGKVITPFTEEQAKADAAERNRRAEELGISTRYVVASA